MEGGEGGGTEPQLPCDTSGLSDEDAGELESRSALVQPELLELSRLRKRGSPRSSPRITASRQAAALTVASASGARTEEDARSMNDRRDDIALFRYSSAKRQIRSRARPSTVSSSARSRRGSTHPWSTMCAPSVLSPSSIATGRADPRREGRRFLMPPADVLPSACREPP